MSLLATSNPAMPTCFLRPTVRAKIKHKKELARIKREEKAWLRKLSDGKNKLTINRGWEFKQDAWQNSSDGVKAHFKALRKYVDERALREMTEAKETENTVGNGCTCNQSEPTVIDKLLEDMAKFPRPVALIISLYLPPKTTPKLALTVEQAEIVGRIIAGQNIFFTGKAGTGKTLLLRKLRSILDEDVHFFTAMTGQAASAFQGMTLHSFAGIKLGKGGRKILLRNAMRKASQERWRRCTLLVIDEVSMLSAQLLEDLDQIAKTIRHNTKPFGGIQVVFSGDFHQLPPVEGNSRLCFESKVFDNIFGRSQMFTLTKVFRQRDHILTTLLEEVRDGDLTENSLKLLRRLSRPLCQHHGIIATELVARNSSADKLNEKRLCELPGSLHTFVAEDAGSIRHLETLDKNCSAPKCLQLKIGAQVVATRPIHYCFNEKLGCEFRTEIHNGQRGIITGFSTVQMSPPDIEETAESIIAGEDVSDRPLTIELPKVKFADGREYLVMQHTFSLEKKIQDDSTGEFRMETLATREQFPLKLAWAMTIHRSQGMTIDKLAVSLAGVFECGQAYVALTRAISLKSLEVRSFHSSTIKSNQRVKKFYLKIKCLQRQQICSSEYQMLAKESLRTWQERQNNSAKDPEILDLTSTQETVGVSPSNDKASSESSQLQEQPSLEESQVDGFSGKENKFISEPAYPGCKIQPHADMKALEAQHKAELRQLEEGKAEEIKEIRRRHKIAMRELDEKNESISVQLKEKLLTSSKSYADSVAKLSRERGELLGRVDALKLRVGELAVQKAILIDTHKNNELSTAAILESVQMSFSGDSKIHSKIQPSGTIQKKSSTAQVATQSSPSGQNASEPIRQTPETRKRGCSPGTGENNLPTHNTHTSKKLKHSGKSVLLRTMPSAKQNEFGGPDSD